MDLMEKLSEGKRKIQYLSNIAGPVTGEKFDTIGILFGRHRTERTLFYVIP